MQNQPITRGKFAGISKKYQEMTIPEVLDYLTEKHGYGRIEVIDHINSYPNRWRNKNILSPKSSTYYDWKKGVSLPSEGRQGILYSLIQDLDTGADYIKQLVDSTIDGTNSLSGAIRQLELERGRQSTTMTSTHMWSIVLLTSSELKDSQNRIASLEKEVSSLKDKMRRLIKTIKNENEET